MNTIHRGPWRPSEPVEPGLLATDIGWGWHGLSVGVVVDPADADTLRVMVRAVLDELARVTAQLERATRIIRELRAELRARRAA